MRSLKALKLDHLDLLLVNWPNPAIPLDETMHALAAAKQSGYTRHIGRVQFQQRVVGVRAARMP
jgi:aryl-alcohol dehydrogenase-like predicted oxidoreductase